MQNYRQVCVNINAQAQILYHGTSSSANCTNWLTKLDNHLSPLPAFTAMHIIPDLSCLFYLLLTSGKRHENLKSPFKPISQPSSSLHDVQPLHIFVDMYCRLKTIRPIRIKKNIAYINHFIRNYKCTHYKPIILIYTYSVCYNFIFSLFTAHQWLK